MFFRKMRKETGLKEKILFLFQVDSPIFYCKFGFEKINDYNFSIFALV